MEKEKKDALTLTSKMLNQCKSPAEIVDLEAVERRWIDTYQLTTGRKDGDLRFHAEKIMFLQTIAENNQLAKCTPMSIYSSFILLAVSGLSLKDGQSYLIPYGNKAVWMPGWKGRLEQINQIPGVKYLAEPICVYANEEFDFEVIDGEYVITKHKPSLNTEGQDIIAVYAVMKLTDGGKRIFLMKRDEVLSIRDRFSESYRNYMLIKPNAEGKRIRKLRNKTTGEWFEMEVEAPMWVTDEAQAFKKTLVKRIYNTIAKEGKLSANAQYADDQLQQELEQSQKGITVDDIEERMAANMVDDVEYQEVDNNATEAKETTSEAHAEQGEPMRKNRPESAPKDEVVNDDDDDEIF